MDDTPFEELLASIRDLKKHMHGEEVPGVVIHEFPDPDVKANPQALSALHQ